MRIVILGTRGIPASYGGFETFAEHLSTRLVARGHEVTVYCRAHYVSPRQLEYHGVRLKVLPTIRHKYFDTVVHAFLSAIHAVSSRFDAALICNAANAPFAPILRLTGTPVALNVDGLEHKRKKWGWLGRRYYLAAERLSTILPNVMVTDAQVIQDYYLARYNAKSEMIAYGAEVERRPDRASVRRWRAEPNRYVLYVSRLEPENNAHLVIEAFKKVRTAYRLLIVGDAPYAHDYISDLKKRARGDKRIVFTGFVFWTGLPCSAAECLLLRACNRGGRNTSCAFGSNGLWQLRIDFGHSGKYRGRRGCGNTLCGRVGPGRKAPARFARRLASAELPQSSSD